MTVFFNPIVVLSFFVVAFIYWKFIKSEVQRTYLLIIYSMVVLFFIHPLFVPSLMGLSYLVWMLKEFKDKDIHVSKIIFMIFVLGILILMFGKYGKTLINSLYGGSVEFTHYLIVPLGISYFVLRIIQFILDYCRGIIERPSFVRFLAFILFLPTFSAGPIETYNNFFEKRYTCLPEKSFFVTSLQRIIIGYFKKVVVVGYLINFHFEDFFTKMKMLDVDQLSAFDPFFFAVLVFIKAYFDLSAYTDLAIGFSGLFGFRIMENFNRPFLKKNLREFWMSWHISLSSWCRNNIFFLVYGATRKAWIGIYASMIVMGLWHYANLSWLAWGLHHATGLVLLMLWNDWIRKYKFVKKIMNNRIIVWTGYVATFCYVAIGYSFVGTDSFYKGWDLYLQCLKTPIIYLITCFRYL